MYKFTKLSNAQGFVGQCTKPMRIMMGDDEMFWVVTPAEAAKLERQGYEFAR